MREVPRGAAPLNQKVGGDGFALVSGQQSVRPPAGRKAGWYHGAFAASSLLRDEVFFLPARQTTYF